MQTAGVDRLIAKIAEHILNPVIGLMFGIAVIFFIYGVIEFITKADSDEGRRTGRNHIIWGILGMFIMLASFGLIEIIINFWKGTM